ncbi:MAG: single-stranded DNA-binding protein [Jatrophihabitans sp.]|nr:MAG: single-stranded DNA-binding protein [Jatrophihabitans sp.]
MPDTHITIMGNVVDEPTLRHTRNNHAVANFRVASTPRRFDRDKEQWTDGDTLFVQVSCWRAMAENVKECLKKGDPVVVHGRYYCRPYEVNEQLRYSYELEAVSVGHDLARGISRFAKVARGAATMTSVPAGPDGLPADESAHWYTGATPPVADPDRLAEDREDRSPGEPLVAELAPA